jgi:hypothetical protein
MACPPTAQRTAFVNCAPKRSLQTTLNSQMSCANYVLQFTNMFKESGHWPLGNWPGKGPVETKPEDDNKDRERLRELAAKIATEQDNDKFIALVHELNRLLDEKLQQQRHNSAHTTDA